MVVICFGLSLLSSVSKHNMWSLYGSVCRCCHPSLTRICGGIMGGFVVVVLPSVKKMCGRILVGFIVVVVSH